MKNSWKSAKKMARNSRESKILRDFNHLLAAGNIISAIPADEKLCSYLYACMKGLSGVESCTICLFSQMKPYGDSPEGDCSSCSFFSKGDNCTNKSSENNLSFGLSTFSSNYAFLSIRKGKEFCEELIPAIRNLTNITAITIENGIQKDSLLKKNIILKNHEQTLLTEVMEKNREIDRNNKELLKLIEILNEAQSIVNIGHWELDIITGVLYWSDEVYRIFGLSPNEFKPNFKSFLESVFKKDRALVEEVFTEAIEKKKSYKIEHRIICRNRIKYVQENGKIYYDEKGKPIRAIGMVLDISERKRNEKIIQVNRKKLEDQNKIYQKLNEELITKNREYEVLLKKLKDANIKINSINKELIVSSKKAMESDRLKTAFLHNMSHEIRTPMNAIIGFSELLPDVLSDRPKAESFVEIILQRGNDLLTLVDDILDISRIESGSLHPNFQKCDLRSFFEDLKIIYSEEKMRLGKVYINFEIKMDPHLSALSIVTDKIKLKQIFYNLIGNAFKYTDNGSIEAGCRADYEHGIVFYVSDTGRGIARDKQKIIFNPFTQLEMEIAMIYGGTGLGLSIVKGLVNLLGGNILVNSEPGEGSTFSFYINYEHENSEILPEVQLNSPELASFANECILIIENDEFDCILIKEILLNTGLEIIFAMNGPDAIRMASLEKPNLILIDISLKDLPAFEIIRTITKDNPCSKIIAMTAHNESHEKKKAFNSGCSDYLTKPLKPKTLIKAIRNNLN